MAKIYNMPPRFKASEPKYPGDFTMVKVLKEDHDVLKSLATAHGLRISDLIHEWVASLEKDSK
jgi:hypothetical protein